jgi:hypothetical protein
MTLLLPTGITWVIFAGIVSKAYATEQGPIKKSACYHPMGSGHEEKRKKKTSNKNPPRR